MTRIACSACKTPLDPSAGAGSRCPICGSPVLLRAGPVGSQEWDMIARRDPAFGQRWELGEMVGQGRSGTVFRAIARDSGEIVAVKLLSRVTDPAVAHLFHMGEGCGPAVDHPSVVTPVACGVLENADGQEIGYLVRPFVDGRSLASELATGPLAIDRSLKVFSTLIAALSAAHRAGLVHGDPKPTDILLTEDGHVRVVDVGAPREPLPIGTVGRPLPSGTPEYLAPEVAAGGATTPASDLYAAAVILIEMITGANPFRLQAALLSEHERTPPLPSELDDAFPELTTLVMRAMAPDPAMRPEIDDVLVSAQELARLTSSRGTLLKLPLPRERLAVRPHRAAPRPARARVVAVLALALLALAGWTVRGRPTAAAPIAPEEESVRLMAGARAVAVRLASPGTSPVRVRCWPQGTSEAAAPLRPSVSPPATGPLVVTIGALEPSTVYCVRVLEGPGDGPEMRVRTLAGPEQLVRSQRVRYGADGTTAVVLALRDPQVAVELRVAGLAPVRATGERAGAGGIAVRLPALGTSELEVAFPELGERVALCAVAGPRERVRAVCARLAKLGDGALPAAPKDSDVEKVRSFADEWLGARLGTSLVELADLAHALFADAQAPVAEKWLLYRALVQLGDLDASGALGIAALCAPLVTVARHPSDFRPPDGARPLADPELPADARSALARAPLPLWPAPPGGGPDVKRPGGRASELFDLLADPDAPAEPLARLPLRAVPGTGDRLEVAVRVAAMTPAMRLMVDAGEGAAVALRSPSPPPGPALVAGTLPERGALEATSEWLVARFPAPEALDRVRLSAVQPGRGDEAMWILDLVVRKVP